MTTTTATATRSRRRATKTTARRSRKNKRPLRYKKTDTYIKYIYTIYAVPHYSGHT